STASKGRQPDTQKPTFWHADRAPRPQARGDQIAVYWHLGNASPAADSAARSARRAIGRVRNSRWLRPVSRRPAIGRGRVDTDAAGSRAADVYELGFEPPRLGVLRSGGEPAFVIVGESEECLARIAGVRRP